MCASLYSLAKHSQSNPAEPKGQITIFCNLEESQEFREKMFKMLTLPGAEQLGVQCRADQMANEN